MAKPVRIQIGTGDFSGDDAPQAKDVLGQVRDFVALLHKAESLVGDGCRLSWRITHMAMSSPLTMEFTPHSASPGDDVGRYAQRVVKSMATALRCMDSSGRVPDDLDLDFGIAAENLYRGISCPAENLSIDFSEYKGAKNFHSSFESAQKYFETCKSKRDRRRRDHKETCTLEGYIAKVESARNGKRIIWLRSRLSGKMVKCTAPPDGFKEIEDLCFKDIFEGKRVRFLGVIYSKPLGNMYKMDVESVYVYPPNESLPSFEDCVTPGFTGGLEANEYLRKLRGEE